MYVLHVTLTLHPIGTKIYEYLLFKVKHCTAHYTAGKLQ